MNATAIAPEPRDRKILIIEDDHDIRETLKDVLELEGYHVQQVTQGQEALETLRMERSPDLIILDLMMPVMNGWEFLELKAQDERLAEIPVVIVSAVKPNIQVDRYSGFVKKPLDLDNLLDTVAKFSQ